MIHSWVTLTPLNLGALILQLPSLKSEPLQGLDGPQSSLMMTWWRCKFTIESSICHGSYKNSRKEIRLFSGMVASLSVAKPSNRDLQPIRDNTIVLHITVWSYNTALWTHQGGTRHAPHHIYMQKAKRKVCLKWRTFNGNLHTGKSLEKLHHEDCMGKHFYSNEHYIHSHR